MYKYLIRFSKKGYIRFTSHLDMMRLFQRSMKRAGILLTYSQGFHPHPRLSIAQPLSLGFTSEGEYVEIGTDVFYAPEKIKEKLSAAMPEGLGILSVKKLAEGVKSPASLIEYGAYDICFALAADSESLSAAALQEMTKRFLSQPEILTQKLQKKTGKMLDIDIKPLIFKQNIEVEQIDVYNNIFRLTATLKTGSTSNLNPELLLKEYLAFTGIHPKPGTLLIHRRDMFFTRQEELLSLSVL